MGKERQSQAELGYVGLIMDKDVFIKSILRIKEAADGGKELIANQVQAMDGYSELANYRSEIEKYAEEVAFGGHEEQLTEVLTDEGQV